MRHADDFSVGSECATVQGTCANCDTGSIIEDADELDAGGGGEDAVAALAAAHARRLQDAVRVVVVEGVVARPVVAVHRHALEAVDGRAGAGRGEQQGGE